MSLLAVILLIGLIGFVVRLDRRLAKLEQRSAELAAVAVDRRDEPEPEPEPAPTEPTVLYAERRPIEIPAAEPAIEAPLDKQPEPGPRFAFSIEDLFGRRLPIWAGGITLAVAGFLIVKLSIEAGLLSPPVRVIAGLIFGAALIGSAEAALRYHERIGDPRIRQALSGAGLASLYASILVAANLYHLIPALAAMAGIAVVTGMAMLLAIRFGAPSALLGLAGGLAAPALVGSADPNVPLLSLYLALAVGGLAALSRNQRWAWLGISALVGGFGWGLALLVGGALDAPATISLGLYILLLGVGLPALGLAEGHGNRLQLIAGILAAAQIAALVATGGFALLNWGLFAAITAAMVWLSSREPALAPLPAVGLAIALLLAAAWPEPGPRELALVLSGIALIHAPMPLRRLWTERGSLLDAAQIAAIALGSWLLAMYHFHRGDGSRDVPLGILALGLSLGAAVIGFFGWSSPRRRTDARFAIVAVASGLLLAAGATLLLPDWLDGIAIAATGLGLLHLGQAAEDRHFEPVAWTFGAAGLVAFVLPDALSNSHAIDSLRCALMAVAAGMFAWRGRFGLARATAQFIAPILAYFAVTPWLPDRLEPLIPAVIIVALAWASTRLRRARLRPAMVSTLLISLLWALEPLGIWMEAGLRSLFGQPLLLSSVPGAAVSLTHLVVPGIALGASIRLAASRLGKPERATAIGIAAILCGIGVHSLYKQLFALSSPEGFVALGLAERTAWEVLLAAAGALAWRFRQQVLASALLIASALHFALYTLLLHNPLWAVQSVGSVPVANLLMPAYGLPLVLLAISRPWVQAREASAGRAIAVAQMVLGALLAFSLLRQLFHGAILVEPGLGQFEDICRSIVAIALAIGFLLWGIVRKDRDWRIGSLVLMVVAVAKVFLSDASGLEGLTRVASFIALGLSLIGIGWLYARFLGEPKAVAAA